MPVQKRFHEQQGQSDHRRGSSKEKVVSAAWAFAKFDFPGKKALFAGYMILMLLPFQVTMVSSYLVLDQLGLMNTVLAIILPGAVSTFPVFLMTRFFSAIPNALTEAAALDGAAPLQIFLHLGLPLGAPGILSAVVLGFIEYWNAFVFGKTREYGSFAMVCGSECRLRIGEMGFLTLEEGKLHRFDKITGQRK